MINFTGKWEELDRTYRSSVTARVAAEHKLNLFVAYSEDGKRQLKLRSDSSILRDVSVPEFENLALDLKSIAGGCELCITLIDSSLKDLFTAITSDLVSASSVSNTEAGAAQIFTHRLSRWAELLEERKKHGLSFSQQLGLLGELYVIDRALQNSIVSAHTIISGWRGPDGDARDINLGCISVEVKAALGTSKNTLKISSLDQLDTIDNGVVIAHCKFSSADKGVCLSSLIEKIETYLEVNSIEYTDFRKKLYLAGYDPEGDYINNYYELIKHTLYQVCEGFPRLTRVNVALGICTVNYEIDCSSLSDFVIDEAELERLIYEY